MLHFSGSPIVELLDTSGNNVLNIADCFRAGIKASGVWNDCNSRCQYLVLSFLDGFLVPWF